MSMYRPSELRGFLHELGIAPKKGLSQNFLIDGNIIRKIIKVSDVTANDLVLEIGPGPGALTQALLEKGAKVFAVEKDPILAKALERFQTTDERLKVYNDDILTFPIQEELAQVISDQQKIKVIANLPYHLTTPILVMIAPLASLFSSITVMVQEEVGRRMTASAGGKEYGSLTLFLNFYTHPRYDFTVSRHCFHPQPKVDSSVVTLELHTPPLTPEESELFFKISRRAFEQRRKMLRASLKELFPKHNIEKTLISAGLNPQSRPEELGLEDFLRLYQCFLSSN